MLRVSPVPAGGEDNEVAVLFNEVVTLNQQVTNEFERLSTVVGKEGKIGHRAKVRGATGGWESKLRAALMIGYAVEDSTVEARELVTILRKPIEMRELLVVLS